MIIKALAAGAAAVLLTGPAQAAPPSDTYRLAPVVENGKVTALSITLTLPADADGETRLTLPGDWGGGEKLWRFAKDLSIEGGVVTAPHETTRIVKSKPGAPLTVRYRVVSAYDGEPPVDSVTYAQPIVGPEGFYVVGHTVFIRPEGRDGDRARFTWDAAGSSLVFASDLERLAKAPGALDDVLGRHRLQGPDRPDARGRRRAAAPGRARPVRLYRRGLRRHGPPTPSATVAPSGATARSRS